MNVYLGTLSDVALQVSDSDTGLGYKVSSRGELHTILIEDVEGYSFK